MFGNLNPHVALCCLREVPPFCIPPTNECDHPYLLPELPKVAGVSSHALVFRGELCAAYWGRSLRASLARPASSGLLRKAFQDSCVARPGWPRQRIQMRARCCASAAPLREERPGAERLGEAPRRLPPISRGPDQASRRRPRPCLTGCACACLPPLPTSPGPPHPTAGFVRQRRAAAPPRSPSASFPAPPLAPLPRAQAAERDGDEGLTWALPGAEGSS